MKEPFSKKASPKNCKHEILEFVEEDVHIVWLRCAKCHVLFEYSHEEFEKLEEVQ